MHTYITYNYLEPKWPLFWLEKASFWRVDLQKYSRGQLGSRYNYPGIPTTIKTMGVNITTIVYLRVLIIQIGSTIILMVVED